MSRPKLHPGGNRKYGPYGVKGQPGIRTLRGEVGLHMGISHRRGKTPVA